MTHTTLSIRATLGRATDGTDGGFDMAYVLIDQDKFRQPAWLSPGREVRTEVVSRALASGLRLAGLSVNSFQDAPGCRASYRHDVFTIASIPLGGALVDPMRLDAPEGWEAAARKAGKIAVFVGDDIVHLPHREDGAPFSFLTPAAARGALALGAVPFVS
ncbi:MULTISPECIES: hypothetical protein [unclassified Streptomyces]|uniref:hypothetical protein n=1 Tax=unclassified Streptomyces TaxID=2593676 RepID=UPI0033AFAD90